MRIPVKKSTSLLGIAAVAASLTLVGCGGDDGGGSDSSTVTIWSSVDQPVQDGLLKALEAKIDAGGDDITVDWQKVENINQLIMTKIQANDTPDIAFIPQPGVVKDIVSRGAAQPLDDVVDMTPWRAAWSRARSRPEPSTTSSTACWSPRTSRAWSSTTSPSGKAPAIRPRSPRSTISTR